MSTIDTEENMRQGEKNEEETSQEALEIGSILRSEREKRGLSQEQVAEITRLRAHVVKAIESENWDRLPPPVFVRGFIRSYARTLGLDEKKLLNLYNDIASKEYQPPQLILEPVKADRKTFVVLILCIAVVAIGIYFWKFPSLLRETPVTEISKNTQIEEDKKGQKEVQVGEARQQNIKEKSSEAEVVPLRPLEPKESRKEKDQMEDQGGPYPDENRAGSPTDEESPAGPTISEETTATAPAEDGTAIVSEGYVLTGDILMRTWIRICIDGRNPKEYIFQPGSRPQWKAQNGFDIIVGNAAGAIFDLNGKKVDRRGKIGQVIRIKVPKEYEGIACGDESG